MWLLVVAGFGASARVHLKVVDARSCAVSQRTPWPCLASGQRALGDRIGAVEAAAGEDPDVSVGMTFEAVAGS